MSYIIWRNVPPITNSDLFYLFYFISLTVIEITSNIYMGKVEKEMVRRTNLTETIGAYERLGLLELRAKAV